MPKTKKANSSKKRIAPVVERRSAWQIFAALALFAVAVLLTQPEEATALEEAIFSLFYIEGGVLVPVFFVITQLGSVYFFAVLSLVLVLLKRYALAIRVLMAGALAYLLAGVGKDLFGRGRPDELFDNIEFHDMMIRGPGFPSGHTAMAVAIGAALLLHTPKKWRWPIVVLTSLAAISRMALGVHTPLDIVGGVAIGWLAAMLFEQVTFSNRTTKK